MHITQVMNTEENSSVSAINELCDSPRKPVNKLISELSISKGYKH